MKPVLSENPSGLQDGRGSLLSRSGQSLTALLPEAAEEQASERGVDWVHLPVIATFAWLLCRELTLQNVNRPAQGCIRSTRLLADEHRGQSMEIPP